MSKNVTINKWGNSLAVRIPQYIIDNLSLEKGDSARIYYEKNRVMLVFATNHRLKIPQTFAEEFDEKIRRQLREKGVPRY